MSLLEVSLYFCCRATRNVEAKNNAVSSFSFWFLIFLLFLFVKKPFTQSAFQDFLFTAAKKYDSLIYYIYICITLVSSKTYRLNFCVLLACDCQPHMGVSIVLSFIANCCTSIFSIHFEAFPCQANIPATAALSDRGK